jgi:ribosomal protein S18 acetylase RimI-like enzyme
VPDRRPRAQGQAALEAAALRIERVTEADEQLADAFARLLPQLSPGSRAPALAELMEVVADRDTTQLVARDDDGAILGVLTLHLYRVPAGLNARIDDVVVDDAARGRGVGEALTREAVRRAELAGARHVELTSRTHREAAHRLYRRLGFEEHETTVFRLKL